MTTEHTPLLLRDKYTAALAAEFNGKGDAKRIRTKGFIVADNLAPDDADTIVRCLKAHDALVKALELYVRQEPGPQYAGPYVHPSKILSTAQAALRAARGES